MLAEPDSPSERTRSVKKTRPIIACLLISFLAAQALAEVNISADCRIKNRPPGRCGWCALETLARHQQVTALYGVTEKNARRARPEDLEHVLTEADVDYRIQRRGTFGTRILREAVRQDRGAVVGFRERSPGAGGHIVTLVDFGAEEVRVIDPNDADGRVRTMSRERFMHWWDGFALVLNPDAN